MATIHDVEQVQALCAEGEVKPGLAVINHDHMACDLCPERGVVNPFPAVVDGKTTFGPWANMCLTCFREAGVGLGLGRGQALIDIKPNGTPDE